MIKHQPNKKRIVRREREGGLLLIVVCVQHPTTTTTFIIINQTNQNPVLWHWISFLMSWFVVQHTPDIQLWKTTLNNGYLGSRNDEERSEMRNVVWIAEFRESSNLWTHIALKALPTAYMPECQQSPHSQSKKGGGLWLFLPNFYSGRIDWRAMDPIGVISLLRSDTGQALCGISSVSGLRSKLKSSHPWKIVCVRS